VKALVIQNPWAWCITQAWRDPDAKTVENRTWGTRHRGDLAVVTGRGVDKAALDHPLVRAAIDYWLGGASPAPQVWPWEVGAGAVTSVADLYDVCGYGPDWPGIECGCGDPWAASGQYHWRLRNVRPLAEPVAVRGRLGLFDLPPDVEVAVRAQLPGGAS
jgi:hypothetical protein